MGGPFRVGGRQVDRHSFAHCVLSRERTEERGSRNEEREEVTGTGTEVPWCRKIEVVGCKQME